LAESAAEAIGAADIAAATAGDPDALARLMAAHDGDMARVSMVICGDADLAREAVQAAWIRAWRHLGSLRDPTRLRPWLMSVAANETRQLIRSQSRRRAHEGATLPPSSPPDPAASTDILDLADAVGRLHPDERRMLALRYVAELESAEIAREIGGSASAVRGRLARIVARLRRELSGA